MQAIACVFHFIGLSKGLNMPARREAPSYNWDDDGGSSKQGSGIYILKTEVQAVVKKPSWFGTETVVRPFPCISFSKPDTDFEPYRIVHTDGRARFSDWIRRYPCAWGVGQNASTFLIKKTHKMYDVWQSPLGVLYKAIESACKKGQAKDPSWYPLREAGMNKGKALKPPGELYLLQGVLLRHDKTEYGTKQAGTPLGWGKNSTMVLMLSSDAGKVLADVLNKEKEGFHGSPTDFEARYESGDPVALTSGRYIHLWERGTTPPSRGYSSQPTNVQPASSFDEGLDQGEDPAAGGASKGDIKKGFDIELTTTYAGKPATFGPVGEEQVRKHWQHWDDILYFPTEVEQAHMLAKVFPASAIIYSFESVNKEWIPDECWHSLRKPKSANFRDQGSFTEPPSDDGFNADASAAPPQAPASRPAAGEGASWETEVDAPGGAEDASLPQGAVETATTVAEAPPTAPTPPAGKAEKAGKETPEEVIARLATARHKVGK